MNRNQIVEVTEKIEIENLMKQFSNITLKKNYELSVVNADEVYIIYLKGPHIEFSMYSDGTARIANEENLVTDSNLGIFHSLFD
ncbi:hypothetical protein [Halalkalibacter okhensis]|uniref:hypothetical protein n=1 Tax=Halalkalibacter okhensis TaxID=333138 RepID=UPI000A620FFC|nr:hypothetical protein [Halalkalibacter okhensis]